jgi:hypothetical protein
MHEGAASDFRRVEAAIYTVGGIVLFVFFVEMATNLAVSLYTAGSRGAFPPGNDPFWVSIGADVVVVLLLLLASVLLFVLARRALGPGWTGGSRFPPPSRV